MQSPVLLICPHTTQAIWSQAMLPKGNLVRTTFKAMSKCSVPLFKGEHSLWNTTPTLKWHLCGAIIVWYIHPLILIAKSPSADSLWWIAMVIAHIVVLIRISLHSVMSLYIYVWINDESPYKYISHLNWQLWFWLLKEVPSDRLTVPLPLLSNSSWNEAPQGDRTLSDWSLYCENLFKPVHFSASNLTIGS